MWDSSRVTVFFFSSLFNDSNPEFIEVMILSTHCVLARCSGSFRWNKIFSLDFGGDQICGRKRI